MDSFYKIKMVPNAITALVFCFKLPKLTSLTLLFKTYSFDVCVGRFDLKTSSLLGLKSSRLGLELLG